MNLEYIESNYLDQLKLNVKTNIQHYLEEASWVSSYFEGQEWSRPTKFRFHEIDLLLPQSATQHYDLENTKRLFTAFKELTISQAIDERLWAYLTHKVFWNYMSKRWSVDTYLEKEDPSSVIRERYFFMANKDRALTRNGISRLWWYGYISYDETRDDPFELTKMLLSKLDITQNVIERSFSRNRIITKSILSFLVNIEKSDVQDPTRNEFRELMKYLNQLGGVTVLDSYSQEELEQLLVEELNNLRVL
ncbi:DUF6339 family protein [Paenibacillus luteus]|uniref:DUF6339 family protein n=1 Tax=Paenibacillus luteus TaxID=2545753 RepID=UPI001143E320|nr:DUF6339 family protein [Paenibacillus luteus]